jgi:hypothetical protein
MHMDARLEELDFINAYPNEIRNDSLSGASEIENYLDRRASEDSSEENEFGNENFVPDVDIAQFRMEGRNTPRAEASQASTSRTP